MAINSTGVDEQQFLLQLHSLAGQLFHSIRMQLSVNRFFAEYTVRGANLDTVNLPLSNAPWLLDQLTRIQRMSTVGEQWDAVRNLTDFTNPGPGGFYDDLGD